MAPLHTSEMDRVELDRDAAGLFCVAARIDGTAATLLIDTGATHTILDRTSMERRGVPPTAAPDDQVAGLGTFFVPTAGTARVRLQLGALDIPAIELMVVDLEEVCKARLDVGVCAIDGILGADLLTAHGAAIVFTEPALYIARSNGQR
jgi:hypothetical protein